MLLCQNIFFSLRSCCHDISGFLERAEVEYCYVDFRLLEYVILTRKMAREGDAFASVNPFSADGPPDDVCNKTLNLIYLYEDFV